MASQRFQTRDPRREEIADTRRRITLARKEIARETTTPERSAELSAWIARREAWLRSVGAL